MASQILIKQKCCGHEGTVLALRMPLDAPAPNGNGTMMKTLLLVEEDSAALEVLARRLEVAGWTCLPHTSGEAALRDSDLRFVEVVVADIAGAPERMNGIELVQALRRQKMFAPVVLMTGVTTKDALKAALNAGVSFLVEKPFKIETLLAALDKVSRVDIDLARLIDRTLAQGKLTPKEEAAARLVLKGLSTAEIAALLANSQKTIKQHLTQIYQKLGVTSRADFFHLVFPT
jgi:DNA-binding NarL/FixJ family response regulator